MKTLFKALILLLGILIGYTYVGNMNKDKDLNTEVSGIQINNIQHTIDTKKEIVPTNIENKEQIIKEKISDTKNEITTTVDNGIHIVEGEDNLKELEQDLMN